MASNVAQGSTRLILIGAAVLLSIGMGLRQSIGLFLTPVTRDLALTAADFTANPDLRGHEGRVDARHRPHSPVPPVDGLPRL